MATFVESSCQVLSRFSGVQCISMPSTLFCVVRGYASLQHVGQSHHFCVCAPSSKFVHSCRLNVLFCTDVTSWVIINKFHVIKNDSTNIHVLKFGPSYDVRNEAEKAVTISCYGFDCMWVWRSRRKHWDHLTLLCLAYEIEGP